MTVGILGLGLIGGSLARAYSKAGHQVFACEQDKDMLGFAQLAGAINGDNAKLDTAYEGSVDLFSHAKDGAGWVPLITGALKTCCDGCWSLNSHMYERETGLFHWEWTFEVTD